jgi:hypothetical protein
MPPSSAAPTGKPLTDRMTMALGVDAKPSVGGSPVSGFDVLNVRS